MMYQMTYFQSRQEVSSIAHLISVKDILMDE